MLFVVAPLFTSSEDISTASVVTRACGGVTDLKARVHKQVATVLRHRWFEEEHQYYYTSDKPFCGFFHLQIKRIMNSLSGRMVIDLIIIVITIIMIMINDDNNNSNNG